ncbi:hypothetical protein KVV02_007271, partial [Mortierella alpina]
LLSIGAVVKVRHVERDLELAISHMVVESFEFYLRTLQETKIMSSTIESVSSAENVSHISQKEQPSGAATAREESRIDGCLITFGECGSDDRRSLPSGVENGACGHSMAIPTEPADGTASSAGNGSPQLGCNAMDRQSLFDYNEGFVGRPLQPVQTLDAAEMPRKRIAEPARAMSSCLGQSLDLQGAVANEKEGDDAWLREDALSPPSKSASQDGVYSMGGSNQEQDAAFLPDSKVPIFISSASFPEAILDLNGNVYPIQQRHREMLLKEIAARRNPLQVFVALDVFEMRPFLMRPLDGGQRTSDTYGSTLVHHLLGIDRLYESAVVASQFLCVRSAALDLELLSRLLTIPNEHQDKAKLVHEFVGDHLDTCRAVLQEIDLRLTMRLAQWSKEDIEGDHRLVLGVSEMFKSSLPGAGPSNEFMMQALSTSRACVRLVEIAMSLVLRFQLEDSQHHYSGIVFFSRYCTVTTLLAYQSSSLEYQHLQLFLPTNSSCTEHTKRLTEYALPLPWVLLPVILSTIKGDRMLQMLTIQHCAVERKDLTTANFIATKLGLGEYYQHSVAKKQNSQPQATADTIQHEQVPLEKTEPTIVTSTLRTPPFSQWLEPTSDQWRSPCAWPRSAATPALPDTRFLGLALHQHQQQQQQQQEQQQEPRVQKPRRAQSVHPLYRLPVNTSVILIDDAAQLPQLWSSLWHSATVGIYSEWRSTMDSRDLNLGYLHRSACVSATSLIQLACDFDNRVYLVDVIALKQDCDERLVKILGNLFANPSVRKIAYDWRADKARLEFTFPALQHRCYQMENLVDLRYVWLHYRYCGLVQADADSSPISFSSCNNTLNNYHNVDSRSVLLERRMRSPKRVDILAWSTLPKNPGLMSRCWGAGLSGMLLRLCGLRLEKTQQCSDWEHRPLSEQQKTFAGEDRESFMFSVVPIVYNMTCNMLIMQCLDFPFQR